jgi:hypothetical protein
LDLISALAILALNNQPITPSPSHSQTPTETPTPTPEIAEWVIFPLVHSGIKFLTVLALFCK